MSKRGSGFRPDFADDSGDLYNSDEYIPPPPTQKTLASTLRSGKAEGPPREEETLEDGTLVRTFFPEALPEIKRPTPPADRNLTRAPLLLGLLRLGMLAVVALSLAGVVVISVNEKQPEAISALFAVQGAQPAGSPVAVERIRPTETPTVALSPTAAASPTPTMTATTTVSAGKAYVPGGTFTMGALGSEFEVTVSPYFIDAYEVTNAQWQACVQAGACSEPVSLLDYSGEPYYGNRLYSQHPVTSITWFDAADYCTWVGGRLPTEAEWEMAARWNPDTTQATLYPWGDEPLERYANTCGLECALPGADGTASDPYPQTAPVGSFERGVSPVGAYDMIGNVAEWVADWFAPYPEKPATDPRGPETGQRRVVRGGAWGVPLSDVTGVTRSRFAPDTYSFGLGVRCVEDE